VLLLLSNLLYPGYKLVSQKIIAALSIPGTA